MWSGHAFIRPVRQSPVFAPVVFQHVRFVHRNLYEVLGVKPEADAKEIKENFYRLSKMYHPDLNKTDGSLTKFKEIAEAYEVLSNPDKRKEYNRGLPGYSGSNPVTGQATRRRSRRFDGMRGEFRGGAFYDEEGPPEMRNIQYDLSPEKMEKIWKRYRERWNSKHEKEREEELEKKKEIFRRKVEKKRENLENMTPKEREDFLFKMRMLRQDAGDDTNETEDTKTSSSESSQQNGFSRPGSHEWMHQEMEKIRKNQDFRKQRTDQIKREINEKEQADEERREVYWRNLYKNTMNNGHEEQDSASGKRPRKKTIDETIYEGLEDERPEVRRARQVREETKDIRDPLEDFNLKGAASFRDSFDQGFQRGRDTWHEMKTSQPFTYKGTSYKHGIWHEKEAKIGAGVVGGIILLFLGLLSMDVAADFEHSDVGIYNKLKNFNKDR